MNKYILFVIAAAATALAGCKQEGQQSEPVLELVGEAEGIRIYKKTGSDDFPDAKLSMTGPENGAVIPGKRVNFSYDISNFPLKEQTSDAAEQHCANSAEGQHIHVILNGRPYLARYAAKFVEKMRPGHYVSLSFLSRSYHESVKSPHAYDLRQFTVGEEAAEPLDLSGPMLFYSRPKDTYVGDDAKRVLLDFYVLNCKMGEKGYTVNAHIQGNVFQLKEWAPYILEGLPMGEVEIKLFLVDPKGRPLKGAYSRVKRVINLKETA